MTIQNKIRPPIVAVMGHIDHGKTSLLDKIRSTSVTRKEAGGITQHIGAYQVTVKQKNEDRLITFIDTPGHAAFCNMRARGADTTDVVVLVVSAVEGVMAQTKECINHIKKANLPFIVAMNKIDLPNSQPDKIKGQLVEMGFTPEEYGGQTAVIPVSAKTGEGIDKLLEMILLHADLLELPNEPEAPLEAVVIESKLDKNRGPVASIIIQKGTLHSGDQVYAENDGCKVKAMIDWTGTQIKEAGPSTPLEVLGFEKTPTVGSIITPDRREHACAPISGKVPLYCSPNLGEETPRLLVVVRADVEGTLEALLGSFSDDVKVIASGVGAVTDNDVFLAETTKAQIFAFNVTTPKFILKLAESKEVRIFESKIIYEIIEDIQAQVLRLLEPTIDETIIGEGIIKAEFKIDKVRIAGVQCTKGEIDKGSLIHLKRDNKIIKDTKVDGIRSGKNILEKVKQGSECGMTFKPYIDFNVGDVIISYKK